MYENINEFEDITEKIVIRILTGVLQGCEFSLRPGKTLFIVTNEDNINTQYNGTLLPENTIYIPSTNSSFNFEVILKSNDKKIIVLLRQLSDGNITEIDFQENEATSISGLKIAWRKLKNQFTNEIMMGESVGVEYNTTGKNTITKNKSKIYILFSVAVFIAIASFISIYMSGAERKLADLSKVLNDNNGTYTILNGKDNYLYIISPDNRSAEWATQSIVRSPNSYPVKITTIEKEKMQMANTIKSHLPTIKFHRVLLNNPEEPIIELSAERNELNNDFKSRLEDSVKSSFPYVSKVNVKNQNDEYVINLASQGLKKLALEFSKTDHGSSITFVITGKLTDSELERAKEFINQFYHIWGKEYIEFVLDLRTDHLEGKSTKFGTKGYVKMTPSHWYFPQNK